VSIIKRYPFWRHYQGTSTDYVLHLRGGRLRHAGAGQAFWFRPANSALSDVPASDQELAAIYHALTTDHQDVTCQIAVTYRFANPERIASRFDFGVFPPTAGAAGLQQVSTVIGQLAQAVVLGVVAGLSLDQVTRSGAPAVRQSLLEGLRDDDRLAEAGIAIVAISVLAVRPDPDVEKALQTPMREHLQAEADSALYARRALAVERERAIEENELANKIELARRREQLLAQEGANARRQAEEAAASGLIAQRAESERREIDSAARAQEIREVGAAEAAAKEAVLDGYVKAGPEVLRALALQKLAGNLPAVGSVTITPDLVTGLLVALGGAGHRVEAGAES
jgi:regulator of protease activity HflC (stomatin/prohibitin superfamily)